MLLVRAQPRVPLKERPEFMAKASETRWVIVGECGLYVGQWQTRKAAISAHASDFLWGHFPTKRQIADQWKECRKRGDKAVKATITFER